MKRILLSAALSLGLYAAAQADNHQQNDRVEAGDVVYTWVDDDGVTHYARSLDSVPQGVEAEKANLAEDGSLSIISVDDAAPVDDDAPVDAAAPENAAAASGGN